MPTLTLVPVEPAGERAAARWDITVALDRDGRIDVAAWRDDPAPWMARLTLPDGSVQEGDLQAEPEEWWQIRLPAAPDAPIHAAFRLGGRLTLGSVIEFWRPDGSAEGWRVVALG
jgi:hypothetical protein